MSQIIRKVSPPSDQIFATTQMLRLLDRYLIPNCSWKWTSDWLHTNVRQTGSMKFAQFILSYQGQPKGSGTEHHWGITAQTPESQAHLNNAILGLKGKHLPTVQQRQHQTKASDSFLEYNGLYFRSEAEIAIAQALEARGILFFANARCRVLNRSQALETREADFFVHYRGQTRILEVDGREYHLQAAEDHKRDRTFERHGLRTTRFTAKECFNSPGTVIEEFLELFNSEHLVA